MRKAFELLAILHDGGVHSGEMIGRRLGISRAAVWSRIERLKRCGVEVHGVPGRGYRLTGGYEFLDADRITNAIPGSTRDLIQPLLVSSIVDSTNQRLLEANSREDIHRRILLAEYQTAGRGRRGDRWYAPPGSGICLSLGWRFDAPPSSISALSLVVGIALARAAERQGARRIKLKWPNDLLFDNRKIAGILIEMRSEFGGPCVVVIGVGLNIALPGNAHENIDQPVADLRAACAQTPTRTGAAALSIDALVTALREFETAGFAPFESQWRRLDALRDHRVRLTLPDRSVVGVARGVEQSGALIVEHDGRRETFIAGHLTLEAES